MNKDSLQLVYIKSILPIGMLFCLFIFIQWGPANNAINYSKGPSDKNNLSGLKNSPPYWNKQKGAHVFGIVDSTDFQPLTNNNLEWVTMVSWGFQNDFDSPEVSHHDGDSLNILRHNSHWCDRIEQVREEGFKVFFKPHLWITNASDGKWRSDIYPTNEENWESWKSSYRDFIVRYAKVAEEANAEMFCIGIEFSRLTVEKPEYWRSLIKDIRSIYSGKITYAANWYKEYEKVSFWKDLDYIGIQAYFPLVKKNYPSIQQISNGWKKYLGDIESVHQKYDRKVLFTEMGYRSTADSAIKPWEWMENSDIDENMVSNETQANCYKAFFNTVWKKEWFAGVHIWQLRSDYHERMRRIELDFTPQGKPAESVIRIGFQ